MDLKNIADKAKQIVDERGGVQSVKEDAQELGGIAQGDGSTTDKLADAAGAVRTPGADGSQQDATPGNGESQQDTAPGNDDAA